MSTIVLPNFLIVGAPKAGTTSLYAWLKQHPSVFLSDVKEPCYFVRGYEGGFHEWDEYTALFAGADGYRAVGEASTAYLPSPESPGWIKDTIGDVRIIISLRNPIDRAWSMYSWMVMEGFEPLASFEAALDAEGIRKTSQAFHKHNPEYWRDYLYFDGGLYRQQVERFLEAFSNVHLLLFDDLTTRSADTFSGICRFLDVNPDVQPEFTAENRSRFPKMTRAQYSLRSARDVARNLPLARRPLTQAAESLMQANVRHGTQRRVASGTRARLRDAYRDEIESLSRLLGRDLSHWLA